MKSLALLLLMLLFPAMAEASITLVQEAHNLDDSGTNATTIAATFGSATTSGNLITVWVGWSGTGSLTVTGVADGGDSFSSGCAQGNDTTNNQQVQGWFAANSGAHTTVTATLSSTTAFRRIVIKEWSGIVTSSPKDACINNFQSAPGTGTDAVTSTAATTATDGDLIDGGAQDDTQACAAAIATISAGTSPNAFTGDSAACTLTANSALRTEHFIQTTHGSIAATFTISTAQATTAGMMAFKASAAAKIANQFPRIQ